MKRLLIVGLSLSVYAANIFSESLTKDEKKCFEEVLFYNDIQKLAHDALDKNDQKFISGGIKYNDYPKEVKKAVKDYAKMFCAIAWAKKIALHFDHKFVGKLLLKNKINMQNRNVDRPTKGSSIGEYRMYVWTALEDEEQEYIYNKEKFLAHPEKAQDAFKKCGELYALLLFENDEIDASELIEVADGYVEDRMREYTLKHL